MTWYMNDDDQPIRVGASGRITYGYCFARDDGHEGYNCIFHFESQLGAFAMLHVHFNRGGRRVNAVRYFYNGGVQGDNIYTTDTPTPIPRLITELEHYPNHLAFFTHLRDAVDAQVIGGHCLPNGELP
ncbi:MAG: hypothetical protein WCH01_09730 [Methylococcaceae bacterium]